MPRRTSKSKVQGEGDYVSARRFQEEERAFVESGRVEGKAREAADALAGPEAEELEEARLASARGKSVRSKRAGSSARPAAAGDSPRKHRERKLDKTLEETFPASDPMPVSPGSD